MPKNKKASNVIVLESGLFPGAVLSLAAVTLHYSIWVAIAVMASSLVGVTWGILLYYKWFLPDWRFPDA